VTPANWASVQRRIAVWIPYLWLLIFFLAPFLIVLKISLSEPVLAQPPYVPVFDSLAQVPEKVRELSLENYRWLWQNALYWNAYLSSIWIAGLSALITLAVGFPIAYGMARADKRIRTVLVVLLILPFWTSFLIRVYAWIAILRPEGLLNQFLLWAGVISTPLAISNTNTAVIIGIVYSYLPFMVLPLYASLERIDKSLLEAAADLGATPLAAFWRVTVPLAIPGIAAGTMLVFIPAVGEFVIPDLLGGSETLMIGRTLWSEFFQNRDWPVASAVAILLLLVLVLPIVFFQNAQAWLRGASR
jgi:putrescine transport system permease protein